MNQWVSDHSRYTTLMLAYLCTKSRNWQLCFNSIFSYTSSLGYFISSTTFSPFSTFYLSKQLLYTFSLSLSSSLLIKSNSISWMNSKSWLSLWESQIGMEMEDREWEREQPASSLEATNQKRRRRGQSRLPLLLFLFLLLLILVYLRRQLWRRIFFKSLAQPKQIHSWKQDVLLACLPV